MFGFIMPNDADMTEENKYLYRSYYCGLCRCLSRSYGWKGKLSLSFDMTFLVMLLTALYGSDEEHDSARCIAHPLRRHEYRINEYTRYAAAMNELLAYYKLCDDASDDKNIVAGILSRTFVAQIKAIREKYPRQSDAIRTSLHALHTLEIAGELNPDKAAQTFCVMTRELFVVKEDKYSDILRQIGSSLGQFIYLCDAVVDLDSDIKRERYNPLVALPQTSFEPMLTVLMSECTAAYARLPVNPQYNIIIKNILYSGVWTAFRTKQKKEAKK